jgi:hypothetical protein
LLSGFVHAILKLKRRAARVRNVLFIIAWVILCLKLSFGNSMSCPLKRRQVNFAHMGNWLTGNLKTGSFQMQSGGSKYLGNKGGVGYIERRLHLRVGEHVSASSALPPCESRPNVEINF